MIAEGCLDGVDEVFGFHNISVFPAGEVRVIPGPIMANGTNVVIKINGRGGHGSVPHMVNDVISCGAAILNQFHAIKSRMIDSKQNIVFTITHFQSGHTMNVFPDQAFMEGTIRSYDEGALKIMKEKIRQIVNFTCESFGCTGVCDITDSYLSVVNHPYQTERVIEIASDVLGGKDKVTKEALPLTAGEDFSYYLRERPGCFYMLGTRT